MIKRCLFVKTMSLTLSDGDFVHAVDCLHYWHPPVGNMGTNGTEGITDGRI